MSLRRKQALALVLGSMPPFLACAPEDYTIELSAQGAEFINQACRNAEDGPCQLQTTLDVAAPTQIRVALLDGDGAIRGASRCAETRLCGTETEDAACNAGRVNEALDGSMPEGLTYDGLEDPATGELVILLYSNQTATDESRCVPDAVLACARLTPVSGNRLDATCAACALSPAALGAGACSDFLSHYPDPCPVSRCRALARDL